MKTSSSSHMSQHYLTCGQWVTYTHCLGKPGETETRQRKVFDMKSKKLSNCLFCYTCNECGVQHTIDSSD
jgi:hypothetical protein